MRQDRTVEGMTLAQIRKEVRRLKIPKDAILTVDAPTGYWEDGAEVVITWDDGVPPPPRPPRRRGMYEYTNDELEARGMKRLEF